MSKESATASTSPPSFYQYHFFISYTTREKEVKLIKPFIDEYVVRLRSYVDRHCPIFYDGWCLAKLDYEPHFLRDVLTEAISKSAFTVCFLSPGYVESEWCSFEWKYTELVHSQRGLPAPAASILPILWKEIPYPTPVLPERRCLDITRNYWKGWDRDKYYSALQYCVQETLYFHDQWFPEGRT